MKKILPIIILLCLCIFKVQAQEDTLQTNRYVMRSTLYGLGQTNVLDTYLSPMEYTGPELRFLRENMRMTKWMNGKVSRQNLFQTHVSLTENAASTGSVFAFLANWNLAYHYQIHINDGLKVMFGPNLDINGGMVYNLRNSNNPINARAYANLGASGMAIYRFRVMEYPFVLRYQLNVPMFGLMFSPEYGQPYYEMSISKNWSKNIYFTSLHNQPAFRQLLTLDFPIKSTVLRVGYIGDIQQAKINHLKSHTWSHSMMIGFVKNFYLLKGKNKVAMPTSVSPY